MLLAMSLDPHCYKLSFHNEYFAKILRGLEFIDQIPDEFHIISRNITSCQAIEGTERKNYIHKCNINLLGSGGGI